MTRGRIGRRLGGLVVAALCAAPATVMAQDTLAAARELYAAADYENALAALNRMQGVTHPADELRTIDQYRAFCLLALNRTDEADRAIE